MIFVKMERAGFPELEASGVALEVAGSAKRADARLVVVVVEKREGALVDVGDVPEELGNEEMICLLRSVCLDGCP